jgi:4-aminobutyrate aminotransferase/(S)-3-amino-2-methylpropionate transaminase
MLDTTPSVPPAPAPSQPVRQRRELVTDIPGPRSLELAARRHAAVASGVSSVMPIFAARAGGGIVVDVDGNSLIDFGSGIAVTSVGNAAPEVVARVRQQVGEFTHTCFTVTPYEGYVEVCEALNRLTPGDHAKRSVLFNSGAEAVENAVTMAMTAKNAPYKDGFGPFAGEVYRAPMSYPFRDPAGMTGAQAAARAISVIESQVGVRNLACLVIEPIQGEGGFVVPAPGFLTALAQWCAAHDVVFIADEIQSGFARTGDIFACEHEGVIPDLVTTAKGIAGGLPLSGVTGRAELMDSVHAGGLGGTYAGNPVSCAAALGAIAMIENAGLAAAARRIGDRVLPVLHTLAANHPQIGDVRGRGAMLAIEIVKPGTSGTNAIEPDAAEAARISAACHRAGLITLTCGTFSNVIRLLPPLVIDDDLLEDGLGVLAAALVNETALVNDTE